MNVALASCYLMINVYFEYIVMITRWIINKQGFGYIGRFSYVYMNEKIV